MLGIGLRENERGFGVAPIGQVEAREPVIGGGGVRVEEVGQPGPGAGGGELPLALVQEAHPAGGRGVEGIQQIGFPIVVPGRVGVVSPGGEVASEAEPQDTGIGGGQQGTCFAFGLLRFSQQSQQASQLEARLGIVRSLRDGGLALASRAG